MTNFKYVKLFCLCLNLILCCDLCELKSISRKSPYKLTKLTDVVEPKDIRVNHNNCANLPSTVLTDVLGAAFNSRYMSIDRPKYLEDDLENTNQYSYTTKRNSELFPPFYVDDTFALEISDKPAWEVKHANEGYFDKHVQSTNDADQDDITLTTSHVRSKRNVNHISRNIRNDRPWECQAKIKWIDLGPDYFPRFLRTVECTKHKCWYGHYICKPRSFTVKLLRRRNGECVQSNQLHRVSNDELPGDLKELWVWEERAVNFCCDCSAK